ncbi:MAG: ATP synthase F1 subunit epsilon [Nitrospinota bacterium]|nr:ATP synthase F1 subunit epsilon [Nitrospinota bacterium]
MAKKTFKLEIITPSKAAYSKDVESITAPGSEGYLGILPQHAPLITSLKEGQLKILESQETEILINIREGFMEVLNNKVVVLVDEAKIEK